MVAHNCHGKNKNIMAKPKTSRQKQNTSWQNQVLHSKSKIALVLLWVFAFAMGYLVFAVRSLVLLWDFWFCCQVFCFCREVFVKFLFLAWGCWFCREVFCICREVFGFVVTVLGHHIETLKLMSLFILYSLLSHRCLPHKILHNHCFQFLLGITVVLREIQNNGYAKFWGVKKLVHYGLCEVWWIGHAPIWHVHGHSIFYPSPSPQRWLEFFFVQHSLWKIVQSVGFEINFWSRSPIGQPFFSI